MGLKCQNPVYIICELSSDRPGVRFQLGPWNNFLARAGGTDSSRGRGFLVKIWSPVRLAEVMK